MNSNRFVGIALDQDFYELAALEQGQPVLTRKFPATESGLAAIREFLSLKCVPTRLALAGAALIGLALQLAQALPTEVLIVSSRISNQPTALARYAERSA